MPYIAAAIKPSGIPNGRAKGASATASQPCFSIGQLICSIARPFGIPDGFIAAAIYGILILLALLGPQMLWARYSLRTLAVLAVLANVLGVFDMARLGAYCFYCLLTTILSPALLWMALLV